ncbi:hypothetical protein TREMEDRAFT_64670 [Tremella mesenterica DSM 1558]|uniref:uncharacterized protein n=1 Tax=Tremella mesenterica (strain ATCC 24925 / CBS 8224 / DSM 1558 / NBRC 9311 / NRRL Y-6157 / RJB 2259-6 / UBC 559-6) TaxID=578456 RepID=UPI0003F49BF2|nr:uncharacterized protein TREMEDRAFT_64670 [Tremella mesenterica DSM 1558]EIW67414.1 hypothetical protein TREMEDRAFT_64670 [Tremella mesenterica DSM 1558]
MCYALSEIVTWGIASVMSRLMGYKLHRFRAPISRAPRGHDHPDVFLGRRRHCVEVGGRLFFYSLKSRLVRSTVIVAVACSGFYWLIGLEQGGKALYKLGPVALGS